MFSSFKKYIMSYCFFVPFSILKKAAIKNGIIVYKHNIKRERSKMDFAGKLTKVNYPRPKGHGLVTAQSYLLKRIPYSECLIYLRKPELNHFNSV